MDVDTPDQEADEAEAGETPDHEAAEEQRRRVEALGQRLLSDVRERIGRRRDVETRWLSALRRYNNEYEPDTIKGIEARKFGSRVFVPLTRRVVNIIEARLSDLLFPTDDRNFVVDASPHPDLVDAAALAKKLSPDAPVMAGGAPLAAGAIQTGIQDLIDEAKRKAAAMQRVVDDQLKECDYPSEARLVMHDALVLGTGVMKGPHPLLKRKRAWSMQDGIPALVMSEEAKPVAQRVDPWNFFPESAACDMEHNGSVFERHELSRLELARLAGQPGFDVDVIREALAQPPSAVRDGSWGERRSASGMSGGDVKKYVLYEYHGPIDADDLRACGCEGVDDDLMVFQACVFLDEAGRVYKAYIAPMDTEEIVYSVFNWQLDSASIFGYGIPSELADLQDGANSSFRAALDNMGLSVGPMVVVDDQAIVPANGVWAIEPNKVWRKTDRTQAVQNSFGFFQPNSHVQELMLVFNQCVAMLNEVGGPAMAVKGEEAIASLRTDFQASMAYAAASVWMRRAVKLWDDGITVPLVRRFVDWNMQFNPDPAIKGDFNVIARGSSALLEAEGQVQKLAILMRAAQAAGIPIRRMVNQLRAMARAMRLDSDELLPSEEEVAAMEKRQAEQGPPPNPEMERIAIRRQELEDNEKERQFKLTVMGENNKMRWAEIASRENMTIEQAQEKYQLQERRLQAQLADKDAQREHEAQMFNAELVTKARTGTGV